MGQANTGPCHLRLHDPTVEDGFSHSNVMAFRFQSKIRDLRTTPASSPHWIVQLCLHRTGVRRFYPFSILATQKKNRPHLRLSALTVSRHTNGHWGTNLSWNSSTMVRTRLAGVRWLL